MASLAALPAAAQTRPFVAFESGQVRPVAMTPDGTKLLAVNTPDNRLEVFSINGGSLTHVDSIPVGMEPVSVAARNDNEIWVVNHLSDSVSVVDLSAAPAKVVRTLLVGDEPRDIVFGGTGFTRAFITTAHRGQQRSDPSIASGPGASVSALTENTSRSGRLNFTELLQLLPFESSQLVPLNLTITPTSGASKPSALVAGPGTPLVPKPLSGT